MARRNNKSRVAAPSVQPAAPRSSGALSFTRPTEFVQLPTEGKFYPEGHPLHLVSEVEINYMSAKEEDILTSQALITRGVVIERFIQSVLVDQTIDVNSLYPGDKNAILIAARATGYGPEYEATVVCPSCSHKHEHTIDLVNLPIKEVPDGINVSPSGTFSVQLPVTKFSVELKILTAKEQKYLDSTREANKKNNLPESNRTDFLKMVVVSINSIRDRFEIEQFIDQMPAQDSRTIKKVYDEVNPSLLMDQTIECPKCKYTVVREVPLGITFLWPS